MKADYTSAITRLRSMAKESEEWASQFEAAADGSPNIWKDEILAESNILNTAAQWLEDDIKNGQSDSFAIAKICGFTF